MYNAARGKSGCASFSCASQWFRYARNVGHQHHHFLSYLSLLTCAVSKPLSFCTSQHQPIKVGRREENTVFVYALCWCDWHAVCVRHEPYAAHMQDVQYVNGAFVLCTCLRRITDFIALYFNSGIVSLFRLALTCICSCLALTLSHPWLCDLLTHMWYSCWGCLIYFHGHPSLYLSFWSWCQFCPHVDRQLCVFMSMQAPSIRTNTLWSKLLMNFKWIVYPLCPEKTNTPLR